MDTHPDHNQNNQNKQNKQINKINKSYDLVTTFFSTYNYPDKIKNYTYKLKSKSKSKSNKLNINREKIVKIIKKKSSLCVKGSDEFTDGNYNPKDKIYIIKVNSEQTIKLLIIYSIYYYLDSIHSNKKYYLGMDFEFNRGRTIALCQVGFFPSRIHKYIFMFDPNMLNPEQLTLIIKTLFISNLNRIVHGCDSLDIPYIYGTLLSGNKSHILLFTKTLYDTRFLCEYYKICAQDDKKCTIYDALLYFNTISNSKYILLNDINDGMGPSQDVNWNISKMSSFHMKYAAYDVLFLHKFFINIYFKAQNMGTHLYEQIQYIPQLTRYIFYEKYNILDIYEQSKILIDPVHNYIVYNKSNGKKITLISLYDSIIKNINIGQISMNIVNLLSINYFKSMLSVLFKRIVYSIAYKYFVIYENKKDVAKIKINIDQMYKTIDDYELGKVLLLLDMFYNESKDCLILIMDNKA